MFTHEDYFKGRDIEYADQFKSEFNTNAMGLLDRVSSLLADLELWTARITSGWRPKDINSKVRGATHSWHMLARAVDLSDPDGSMARAIKARPDLLNQYGLWMEDPKYTKGWVHLDTGERRPRKIRIFIPH